MSSYFSLPSFARAKKNKEDLEKTNPTEPVLKDEDEQFLTKVTSQEAAAPEGMKEAVPMQITEDGKEKEVPQEETKAEKEDVVSVDQVVLPEQKFDYTAAQVEESKDDKDATTEADAKGEDEPKQAAEEAAEAVDDPPEVTPDVEAEKTERPAMKSRKSKKNTGFDLPSQEEAEAATRGFNSQQAQDAQDATGDAKTQGDKRTWASYLPSMPKGGKKDTATPGDSKPEHTEDNAASEKAFGQQPTRTWAEYASTASAYASSAASSLPSLPASWTRSSDKDASSSPVYNEDGTINEAATKEKQEKEVSVLLDNLSLSSINNRVFSFSAESQKFYDRFTQVLKDTLNGAPTAYEDMDKLMKEAGPTLEKNFNAMPPFVQTLVKALPAKLGTTLGPELMAAASEKPGNDLKARMAATTNAQPNVQAASTEESKDPQKKQKRKIPGLKGLVSEQGMVASILRNIVNFLRVRFPFLMSTGNVVMSLAVFILMFVFWYCHKRGKESRLLNESATADKDGTMDEKATGAEEEADEEYSESEEGEGEDATASEVAEQIAQNVTSDSSKADAFTASKEDILSQSEPSQVPLPDADKGEKGAALEETKSVGV